MSLWNVGNYVQICTVSYSSWLKFSLTPFWYHQILQRNIAARWRNNCCNGKSIGITYSECMFVALVIQHANSMCHLFICGLSGCTIFIHMSQKGDDFRKKKKELFIVKCSLIFSATFIWNFPHSNKIEQDIKMSVGLHVQYPLVFYYFNETWIISTKFLKILKYHTSWKFL